MTPNIAKNGIKLYGCTAEIYDSIKAANRKKLLWLIIPSILIQSNEIKFATIKSSDPEAEMISQ